MKKNITFKNYNDKYFREISKIINDNWHYNELTSTKTAEILSFTYLYSCLSKQTFTKIALIDNIPVGIIIANCKNKFKFNLLYKLKLIKNIFLLAISSEGRKVSKIFGNIDNIDNNLLTNLDKDYPAELVFFAVDPNLKGIGIGKKLFNEAIEYFKDNSIDNFYLFTDTTCNFGFYEHKGMVRKGEVEKTLNLDAGERYITFYIYDMKL